MKWTKGKQADGLTPSEIPEQKIFKNKIIVKIVHPTTHFCNDTSQQAPAPRKKLIAGEA
jgi:hypothetical protein